MSVYEVILDPAKFTKTQTVLLQQLYTNGPLPVQNNTNFGSVRMSTSDNLLAVQTSNYDNIQLYTVCAYDEKPSASNIGSCVPISNSVQSNGNSDQVVVLDPFFPNNVLKCSQRTSSRVKAMGKQAQAKLNFICSMNGQGPKQVWLIVLLVIVGISVAATIIYYVVRCIRNQRHSQKLNAELRRRDMHEESGQLELVNASTVAIDFCDNEHRNTIKSLLSDIRKNAYSSFARIVR
jgi:hypothetical protein